MPRAHLPSYKPPSQGEQWWIKVRTSQARTELALGISLSFPIPSSEPQILNFFQYNQNREGLCIPVARLTAKLPELEISSLRRGTPNELFPEVTTFGFRGAGGLTREGRLALFSLIPAIVELYPNEPPGEAGKGYMERLAEASQAELKPYYEALNPDFFEWAWGRRR